MSKAEKRSAARLAAVQALYQMEITGAGVVDATVEFERFWIGKEVEGLAFKPVEDAFFRDLVAGVVREQKTVDRRVDEALARGWPLRRIETVLRAILRVAAFELLFRRDVPPRVTITEYVDVARAFYDGDEPGLVNAVLDTLARSDRNEELLARH
ncbi:transcription antitermination factor NusB [Pseudochelatococcus contaminans]|uniref:Transcription antitermination protein NusB n=1 Tax=Pseudochelatococcus contaminans TaxID=1538103 RepID=A0A7W5Z514_9HYPH|nr:transcription antitermination factor NusB [Pseudochelatococcus contaminans]MBB3810310.1 N utilization substance protein B [Pseudochelatococcus contaminans]